MPPRVLCIRLWHFFNNEQYVLATFIVKMANFNFQGLLWAAVASLFAFALTEVYEYTDKREGTARTKIVKSLALVISIALIWTVLKEYQGYQKLIAELRYDLDLLEKLVVRKVGI